MIDDHIKSIMTQSNKVALAVSGGKDSMALLAWFVEFGEELPKFYVINVEHGIRGEESVSDSKFVTDYCAKNSIECKSYSVDAPGYADKNGVSVETAARTLRQQIYAEQDADYVLLAHHLDDNVESILMHLFRGSGLKGLEGMSLISGKIMRPLIETSRKEIEEYVENNNIPFREDSTNNDTEYRRNFIRKKIAPKIKEVYPGYKNAIISCAKSATLNRETVEDLAHTMAATCKDLDIGEKDTCMLPIRFFAGNRMISYLNIKSCFEYLGIFADIEEKHYNKCYELQFKENGKQIDMPHFITAKRTKEGIVFYFDREKDKRKRKNYGVER